MTALSDFQLWGDDAGDIYLMCQRCTAAVPDPDRFPTLADWVRAASLHDWQFHRNPSRPAPAAPEFVAEHDTVAVAPEALPRMFWKDPAPAPDPVPESPAPDAPPPLNEVVKTDLERSPFALSPNVCGVVLAGDEFYCTLAPDHWPVQLHRLYDPNDTSENPRFIVYDEVYGKPVEKNRGPEPW